MPVIGSATEITHRARRRAIGRYLAPRTRQVGGRITSRKCGRVQRPTIRTENPGVGGSIPFLPLPRRPTRERGEFTFGGLAELYFERQRRRHEFAAMLLPTSDKPGHTTATITHSCSPCSCGLASPGDCSGCSGALLLSRESRVRVPDGSPDFSSASDTPSDAGTNFATTWPWSRAVQAIHDGLLAHRQPLAVGVHGEVDAGRSAGTIRRRGRRAAPGRGPGNVPLGRCADRVTPGRSPGGSARRPARGRPPRAAGSAPERAAPVRAPADAESRRR